MTPTQRAAVQAGIEALERSLPIIQSDAAMMSAISRHAPLDAEAQAQHDSTEYESEKLERDIPAALTLLRSALQGGAEPVAWRVRGYNQFKAGEPGEWRYRTGSLKPVVNNPGACDFEPLYTHPGALEGGERSAAVKLWMLLDDIDTLDDACRTDDAAFRNHTRAVQRKRFDIISGNDIDALKQESNDGR